MGTLLDALSQENLDNQREVVKNEKRWSYDNRPYGSWYEKLQGHLFPEDHPYHHATIGSMEDLDAASVEDVSAFFRTYYAPNNAVLSVVGDVDPDDDPALDRALLRRRSRPTRRSRRSATCRCRRRSAASVREIVDDRVPLPRVYVGLPRARVRRPRGSTRSTSPPRSSPAARARDSTRRLVRDERIAQDVALVRARASSAGRRSAPAGRRSGPASPVERVEAALHEELERLAREPISDDELARARALIETEELGGLSRVEERADRLSMYATLFDDPDLINRMLPRYLSVTAEQIRPWRARRRSVPDNRVVLTYLPELPPADTPRRDDDATATATEAPTRRSRHERASPIVAERPTPGEPRPYDFPAVERTRLPNGLCARRRRPARAGRSSSASLVLRNGAVDEPRRPTAAPPSSRPGP